MGCRTLVERRGIRRRLAVALTGLAVLLAAGSAAAQERAALVIGNGAYEHQGRLPNPPNDAADMGAALDRLGFQVTSVIDADVDTMLDALDAFESRAASADVALVFFAGHGIEVAGRNYLIPVDAELARQDRVDREAISLDRLLEKTAGARLQLVILDACRNNPFAERMARTRGAPSRGLAVVAPRANDSGEVLVALSTAPGKVAEDGEGENSPFAAALLEHIEAPGLEVGLMFRRVKRTVEDRTVRRQSPWLNLSLRGQYYLAGGPAAAPHPLVPTAAELYEQPSRPAGAASAGDGAPTGLMYRVMVPGPGDQLVAVDPNTPFRSGARVVLEITPNVGGFLYMAQRGTDGSWEWIRPGWGGAVDFTARGQRVEIPPGNWIEFDSTPGIERVFVYLSRERDDGVLGVEFGAGGSPVAVQPPDQGTVNDLANGIGSQNLVLGKERRPAASAAQGQAVYVVNPAGGGVWTLIELIHR